MIVGCPDCGSPVQVQAGFLLCSNCGAENELTQQQGWVPLRYDCGTGTLSLAEAREIHERP